MHKCRYTHKSGPVFWANTALHRVQMAHTMIGLSPPHVWQMLNWTLPKIFRDSSTIFIHI
uniref:Uncharacterized protein n=1 Tax=Anguilla anguilla TaxID=7936 RepID=A0A0E9TQN4_ANGAN